MENFEIALAVLEQLQTAADTASREWNTAFPRDPSWPMGLTPDHIKFSPEYREYRARYVAADRALKAYWKVFKNLHLKQYRAHMKNTREKARMARLVAAKGVGS